MINEVISKNIIYIDKNSSIKDASILMKKKNIGFLPIKDDNKYIGVITDRDICLSLSSIKSIDDKVTDYMTKDVIYINYSFTFDEALDTMAHFKVKRLLVKEKDNGIGILSLSDIIKYYSSNKIIDTIKTIFYIHDSINYDSSEIDEFYL